MGCGGPGSTGAIRVAGGAVQAAVRASSALAQERQTLIAFMQMLRSRDLAPSRRARFYLGRLALATERAQGPRLDHELLGCELSHRQGSGIADACERPLGVSREECGSRPRDQLDLA